MTNFMTIKLKAFLQNNHTTKREAKAVEKLKRFISFWENRFLEIYINIYIFSGVSRGV